MSVTQPHRFPWPGAIALAILLSLTTSVPVSDAALSSGVLITLDAGDADLPSILKILAERGDLNIITGTGVSGGKISIHMKNVPVEQALNLVVRAAGLSYERIGNSVLVADEKTLKQETGLSSYIVELKYADAKEVATALKTLSADMQVDPGGNRLIVVTSPRVIAEIEELVRVIDVPAQQVMLEARIVEVSTDAAKKLGIDWDLLNSQGVVIVENAGDSTSSPPGLVPNRLPFLGHTPGRGDLDPRTSVARQARAFQVVLDLMIHDGNARVLANPKIATLNGREASMLVGSRIPFVITGTVIAGGGAAATQTIQREEVGIKLRITPTINSDGFITTVINPEVSSVIGFTGPDNSLPIIATRQANTTVRLKDGSSVIIGGLLSEEKTTNITKLPLLGDIPGLGVFFRHTNTTTTKKDLVIEVTPHILPEQK
jgi:type IV pilus assembly protein PilQ